MCDPILGALIKMQPIILHLVVKMRLHPAKHTHWPTVRKYPPTGGAHRILNLVRPKEENPNIFHTDVLQNIKFNDELSYGLSKGFLTLYVERGPSFGM